MSRKKKFDLTALVHQDDIKEGDTVFFVSDPSKKAVVTKMPNGEFKLKRGEKDIVTVHAFAQDCLGTEPPNHATVWVRNASGKTLYDIWHSHDEDSMAA